MKQYLLVLEGETEGHAFFETVDEVGGQYIMTTEQLKYAHRFESEEEAIAFKADQPNGDDFEVIEDPSQGVVENAPL